MRILFLRDFSRLAIERPKMTKLVPVKLVVLPIAPWDLVYTIESTIASTSARMTIPSVDGKSVDISIILAGFVRVIL